MNCIKKFSRIVCVSLFSYQGCFAVSSLRQLVYFIISSWSCQALFSKVFEIFQTVSKVVCFCRSVQATWLLYHKFSHLSTVNLNFLKTILFFSISEAIPCDSLFILPLSQGGVKHFLQKTSIFFCAKYLSAPSPYWEAMFSSKNPPIQWMLYWSVFEKPFPQSVRHTLQKAFFKHALALTFFPIHDSVNITIFL